jgi:hypothetical protein
MVGRDSSVVIATRYQLEGPGIKPRCGRDFPHPSRQTMGPTQLHIRTESYSGVKQMELGADHSSPSSPQVKERVQPYIHSLSGTSWPVLWLNLPLPFTSTRQIYLYDIYLTAIGLTPVGSSTGHV